MTPMIWNIPLVHAFDGVDVLATSLEAAEAFVDALFGPTERKRNSIVWYAPVTRTIFGKIKTRQHINIPFYDAVNDDPTRYRAWSYLGRTTGALTSK